MSSTGKVVAINVGILLSYVVLVNASSGGHSGSTEGVLGAMITLVALIILHVFANAVIATVLIAQKKKKLAQAFILSCGVVLLVGFATCYGSAALHA